MISIDLSETTHFGYCQSETKSKKKNFSDKKLFFSDFFLGLDFVSEYTPQLYFACNHLITKVKKHQFNSYLIYEMVHKI